jgi:hypothetical protein
MSDSFMSDSGVARCGCAAAVSRLVGHGRVNACAWAVCRRPVQQGYQLPLTPGRSVGSAFGLADMRTRNRLKPTAISFDSDERTPRSNCLKTNAGETR